MGLYNLVFGVNPMADIILATLGLTREDVGRFRDAFVADGKIAIYTRNGGANRECWCAGNTEYGTPQCRHHTKEIEIDEIVYLPEEEARAKGYELINITTGTLRGAKTGRKVTETRYVCEEPNSEECGCVGCFMTYRVQKLPYYLYDEDDSFDETYATIYFSFPPEHAELLKMLDRGEPFNPDERWREALKKLKEGKMPHVVERVQPLVDQILKHLDERNG